MKKCTAHILTGTGAIRENTERVKSMPKYIIDIPDGVPVSDELVPFDMCRPSWWGDAYEKGVEAGRDDAWELAGDIAYRVMSYGDCLDADMLDKNEKYSSPNCVLDKLTYQEAKDKYDAWKKSKEEFRVGDEVVYVGDQNKEKAIVLRLYQPKQYKTLADILCEDGTVIKMVAVENLAWTGRHFDEVEEMLKKMKEGDRP